LSGGGATDTHRRRLLAGFGAVLVVSRVNAQGARSRILWLSLIPPAGRAGGLAPTDMGLATTLARPGTVELVVNLKSAQALGITVPPILLRADRVIV
jgi:hypothetical protein